MKTRQFDNLLAKEPVNIKRTNQECAGLPPPLGNRCRPQKIKCNRRVPKEINQKIKDFLQDIKPGIYYPVRGKIKRNPKSMQIGCPYAGNICTEENGSGWGTQAHVEISSSFEET